MVTSVTDTRANHGTPRTLAPLVTNTIKDKDSAGVSTQRADASWISDIEHVYVNDDPRKWSRKLKVSVIQFVPLYRCHVLIHRPITLRHV
jgi:hypothetical protein